MSNQTTQPHGVMEGKGAYNQHAKLPGGGAALAAAFLEEAARAISLDHGNQPIVIADYGSSQGKNSLAPMQIALQTLRPRLRPDRAIFVFHIDQPSNDFNSLFDVLSSDPDRYTLGDSNVFSGAIGRSFYEQVLPSESVHLAWSSYAAVWLSRIATPIPGHFMPLRSTAEAKALWKQQAALDWKLFLTLRARELKPGGRLLVVLPARNDEGVTNFENLMDTANAALGEMVDEGEIAQEERDRMILGTYPRQRSELLEPFVADGKFQNLKSEHCGLHPLPDAAWPDYERDGDAKALATRHALFFRAVFVPSLGGALNRVREGDPHTYNTFADRLQQRMIKRLAANPAPIDSFVQTMVLARCD
jgi:SAM dependent carboxyl methyltransferase